MYIILNAFSGFFDNYHTRTMPFISSDSFQIHRKFKVISVPFLPRDLVLYEVLKADRSDKDDKNYSCHYRHNKITVPRKNKYSKIIHGRTLQRTSLWCFYFLITLKVLPRISKKKKKKNTS